MARTATRAVVACLLLGGTVAAQEPLERRLVRFRATPVGVYAEADPSWDYTTYLPRRFQIFGVDPTVLLATATSGGLPVRLLGRYQGDRVEVAAPALRLEPPVLPLALSARNPWRGVVELRNGGRELSVLPGAWQACQAAENPADGRYRVTAWSDGKTLQVADLTFLGPAPPPSQLDGPLTAIVSEGFIERSISLYRSAHRQQFAWKDPSGTAGFELERLGLTTVNGPLRCFATLNGQLGMFGKVVEGEWEAPLSVSIDQGWVRLQLQAHGQQARLVRPFFAELPGDWSDALVGVVQSIFSNQLAAVPIPGAYVRQLLDTGLITAQEMDHLQVLPCGTGDRRSGCLLLQESGRPGGPPVELARVGSQGFALGISAPALNRCLATWFPAQLPIKADLPADRVPAPQVLIFKLRLRQMEVQRARVSYQNGQFVFEDAEVAVHWSLGPLSGVEPGARLSGTATPVTLPNKKVGFHVTVSRLEFLSPQILQQSAPEQERLRQQIVDGLQQMPVPLPVQPELITEVNPRTPLQLVQVHCEPDRLWLEGRWAD